MENLLFLDIIGSLIGLALAFGLAYGGIFAYRNYQRKVETGACLDGDGKGWAYGGLFGGLFMGVAVLIFIIYQWAN